MRRRNKLQMIGQRLIAYEWLWLLIIAPLVLFPSPVQALILLVLPLLWLLRRLGKGRFVPPTPVDWVMLVLLLMVLVSLYATFDINFSLGKIAGMVYGVAVFYAVVAYVRQSAASLWRAVGFFLLMGLGLFVSGVLGTQWMYKFGWLQPVLALLPQRVLSLPGSSEGFSSNQLAGTLLLVMPLALLLLGLILGRWRRLGRRLRPYQLILVTLFIAGVALATGSLLLLTQSRSGLFGFAVGLLFIILVIIWQKSRLLFAGALLSLVMGAGFLTTSGQGEGLTTLLFEQAGLEAGSEQMNTLSGRVEIWSRAIYGIQDFPITGMGMNNFRRVVPILYPLFLIPPETDIAHAHNQLLQAALDLGIPGLVAYLALWLALAALLWQSWRQAQSPWLRGLVLGFAGSLLAHFIFGMLDAVALGAKPGFIFWYLAGLVVGLHEVVRGTAVADSGAK